MIIFVRGNIIICFASYFYELFLSDQSVYAVNLQGACFESVRIHVDPKMYPVAR